MQHTCKKICSFWLTKIISFISFFLFFEYHVLPKIKIKYTCCVKKDQSYEFLERTNFLSSTATSFLNVPCAEIDALCWAAAMAIALRPLHPGVA